MSVAFFDLDGTLLDCNSGTLWLRHEWRDGRVGFRDAAWATWVLFQYSMGNAELDQAFIDAVATLAGTEEAFIAERTRAWFAAQVRHRLRPGAEAVLASHRSRGDRLVLATSSSIYAAREAVAAFGLDEAIASEFRVLDGRFTGEVQASMFGKAKLGRAEAWARAAGVDLATCTFYTDSYSDLALLERVGHPVAVHPDRKLSKHARARGWAVADWGGKTD